MLMPHIAALDPKWPSQALDGKAEGGLGRLFPMAGSLRTDGLNLSALAGEAGKPPILRPVELTACAGTVGTIVADTDQGRQQK